jgi:hypothetical protein
MFNLISTDPELSDPDPLLIQKEGLKAIISWTFFVHLWCDWMKAGAGKVYQFEVSLLDVEPQIWRSIEVPSDYSFWDLHVAIQDAMGWFDSHLHEFEIISPDTLHTVSIGVPEAGFPGDTLPGWELLISDYLRAANAETKYSYDFGDGWEHRVRLKGIVEPGLAATYPRCVAGERACPPEDCGGSWGYQ